MLFVTYAILAVLGANQANAAWVNMSVTIGTDGIKVSPGITLAAAAYGSMQTDGMKTGWNVLDVVANQAGTGGNNTEAFYAAGYLEAALTCEQIAQFSQNNGDAKTEGKVVEFISDSHRYGGGAECVFSSFGKA